MDIVTLPELAVRWGITRQGAHHLYKEGHFKTARLVGRDVVIDQAEVEALSQSRSKPQAS